MKPELTLERISAGDVLPELAHQVTATTVVLGALAARDWRPMHHDHAFAVERNGVRDIFLNTPNQAAWFERCLTDWTGPHGRPGRMRFRMREPVFPGEAMSVSGTVTGVAVDGAGCGWAEVALVLRAGGAVKTECAARIAVPTGPGDNPWRRRGALWLP